MSATDETKPATVSFSRAKQAAAAANATPAPVSVPATVNSETAVAAPAQPNSSFVGEFTSTDMLRPPSLKYVSGNGDLAVQNPEWRDRYVWDGAICLGTECVVIPTKCVKFYREAREWGDPNPTPPATFKTKAEADASGLEIMDVACIELLVELNDAQAAMEPTQSWATPLGGKTYLPAVFWVQKTSYDCARTLAHMGPRLGGRLANGQFKLSSKVIQGKKGPYRSPDMKLHGKTPPEVSEAILKEFKI